VAVVGNGAQPVPQANVNRLAFAPVSVRCEEGKSHPWLEVQFFSKGPAISISK
jgi:hypothetical protein